jgi:cytochrome P450
VPIETSETTDVFGILTSPEVRRDPYGAYARLLAAGPVVGAGADLRFVFGYDDCVALLRDRRASVDERKAAPGLPSPDTLPTLIHLDPPDHTRLRDLVASAFTPRRVEGLRHRAVELVDEALGRFGPGDEIDVIAELAYPMPLAIICDLLGVAADERPLVRECSTWMARSIDPGVLRSAELNVRIDAMEQAFIAYIRALVAERRRRPGDDLLSDLVAVEAGGDRLTEDELVGLAMLLLVAGHETTVSLVGNGLLALLRDPAQQRAVRDGLGGERRAVNELPRYDAPVQMTTRVALDDVELPSATIPKGSFVVLMLGSANRDPRAFADPHRLDVLAERGTAHLAFGSGIHYCLGAALARAEAEVAIPALLRRFPAIELLDPEPPVRPTFVLRGRESLRVRL